MRVGTSPGVILEAIRERAWLPEQIQEVDSKNRLEDRPPPLPDFPKWVDAKIAEQAKDGSMESAYRKTRKAA